MNEFPDRKSILLADIVHGFCDTVRITADGLLHAVDLVMAVTGKGRDYAGQILREIKVESFDPSKFQERQLSSRGGPKTKLVTMDDAIELIMVLPGQGAKEIRKKIVDIIQRCMAGDQSMVCKITR